eukprot:s494_g1.t1
MFEGDGASRAPGDLDFGKRFLPQDKAAAEDLALKDLTNGRLAMLAFSGMVHHNLIVKGPLFPLFPEGYVGPQGSWDLDSVAGALNSGRVQLRCSPSPSACLFEMRVDGSRPDTRTCGGSRPGSFTFVVSELVGCFFLVRPACLTSPSKGGAAKLLSTSLPLGESRAAWRKSRPTPRLGEDVPPAAVAKGKTRRMAISVGRPMPPPPPEEKKLLDK